MLSTLKFIFINVTRLLKDLKLYFKRLKGLKNILKSEKNYL